MALTDMLMHDAFADENIHDNKFLRVWLMVRHNYTTFQHGSPNTHLVTTSFSQRKLSKATHFNYLARPTPHPPKQSGEEKSVCLLHSANSARRLLFSRHKQI